MNPPNQARRLNRRGWLALAGGTAMAAGLAACGLPQPERGSARESAGGTSSCVDRSELTIRTNLGGTPLAYEDDPNLREFALDPDFADQLDDWWTTWNAAAASPSADWIGTYGTWINGRGDDGCRSWHNSGRAIDFTRLMPGDPGAGDDSSAIVSLREDRWRDASNAADLRRRYWAFAASLHRNFAYVVTYLYNDAHRNHIHVDNGQSGSELAQFRSRSRTQVQAAQAICLYLYEVPADITGNWDGPTRRATDQALERAGINGRLTDDGAWTGLMTDAMTRGG